MKTKHENEQPGDVATVPFFAYEGELTRLERINWRLLAALAVCNMVWMVVTLFQRKRGAIL